MIRIGFGGGCHWCTEAVFGYFKGVKKVQQGWIASVEEHMAYSEAVLVDYEPEEISLEILVEAHLSTHSSQSAHSMRDKYRSAIYVFDEQQAEEVKSAMDAYQRKSGNELVTKVLRFGNFKLNNAEFLQYYKTRPDAPFCKLHIAPKLERLQEIWPERGNKE